MGYIDPFLSDAEVRKNHGVLSRRQAQKDHLEARAEGGMDAAIAASKRPERASAPASEGWMRPKGMSRSGAMTPQVKARLANDEAEGHIELLRNVYGEIEMYREIGT